MDTSLVSVLIPVYNCSQFVEIALNSVIKQSYTNLEILVCDDCSTDGSLIKIQQLAKQDSRIRVCSNPQNLGKVKTIQRMLKMSKGDYIGFLDADDYLSHRKIELQVMCLNENPEVGLCGCNFVSVSHQGQTIFTSNLPLSDDNIRKIASGFPHNDFPFCCASVLIRRVVYEQIGGYRAFFVEHCIGEDIDWILRIMNHYGVANIEDVGYYYRFNRNSLTRKIYFSLLDRHIHEIISFLARQREVFGKDCLETGDTITLQNFINSLSTPYKNDKSLYYKKIAVEFAINKDSKNAHMYFNRFLRLNGCKLSSLKVFVIIKILLMFDYSILAYIKRIFRISHLSSKI